MGSGVSEGEIEAADEAEAAIDAVKRYASTGYVRNSLVVFHNHGHGNGSGNGIVHSHADAHGTATTEASALAVADARGAYAAAADNGLAVAVSALNGHAAMAVDPQVAATLDARLDKIREARLKGYEGDACGECGNFTLVRNGTCLKCTTCGSTSGCS